MVSLAPRGRVSVRVELRLAVQPDKQRLADLPRPPTGDGGLPQGLLQKISDSLVSTKLLLPLRQRRRHPGSRLKRNRIL